MESSTDFATFSQTITTANMTSTPTSEDTFRFDDPAQRLVVAVTFIIVSVIGTIGNTLVIAAVAVSRKLRTITNVFVVNLAVADLLTSLFIPWNAVALISRNGWPLHPYICTIAGAITYLCIVASLYSLASVAINRFILVTKKHQVYQKIFTKRNLIIWIILIWVVSFLLVVFLPIVDVGGLGYNEKYSTCGQSSSHPRDDIYQLVQAMGSFPIPLIIICYSYIKIFIHVRNHMRVMSTHMPGVESNQTDSTVAESVAQTIQEGSRQTAASQKNGHPPAPPAPHSATLKDSDRTSPQSAQDSSKTTSGSNTNTNENVNTNNSKVGVVKRDSQTKSRLRRGASSLSFNKRQLQITKNMFMVVCAFFLCIAPFTSRQTAASQKNGHPPAPPAPHSATLKDSDRTSPQSAQDSSKTTSGSNTNTNENVNTNNSKVGVVKRDSQTKSRLRRGASSLSFNKRQLQITKNMFMVVCAFFLCIAPFTFCLFFDDSDPFVPYASAIVLCNACVNPFIYATKHPVFNTVMTSMIRCRFKDIPEPVMMVHRIIISKS